RGAPQVWVARDDTTRAAGPFPTRWFELKSYEQTRDTSPRSPLTGFYGAQVEFPVAGNWMGGAPPPPGTWVLPAALGLPGARAVGRAAVPGPAKLPGAVGSKAKPVATPVAT